jgi:hypothetical protein
MEPLDSTVLCRREGDLVILERKPAVPPVPPPPPEADELIEASRGLDSVILLCMFNPPDGPWCVPPGQGLPNHNRP